MSYQENYQKWVDFAELPDYLRQDLENIWIIDSIYFARQLLKDFH